MHWVFIAVCRLSLVVGSRGYSSLWCMGSKRAGFSSCGTRAQQLRRTGLVALRHVGSSWTRARTRVPCVSRRILNHCTTREVPIFIIELLPKTELFCLFHLFFYPIIYLYQYEFMDIYLIL